MGDLFLSHSNIDTYYSNEDVADIWYESKTSPEAINGLRRLVNCLSNLDQKIYDLYFIQRLKQEVIAKKLKRTQGNVNYRIDVIQKALQYIGGLPSLSEEVIERNIKRLTEESQNSIREYLKTPNFSTVGKKLNYTSVAIIIHYKKALSNEDLDQEFIDYLKYLKQAPPKVQLGNLNNSAN